MKRGLQLAVINTHAAYPGWGATEIAHHLGCGDAYVRSTAQRCALKLPRSRNGAFPSQGAAYCRHKRAALV